MLKGNHIAQLLKAAGIEANGAVHNDRQVILLRYPKENVGLTKAIKSASGTWSRTHSCWYMQRDAALLEKMLALAGYGFAEAFPDGAKVLDEMARQIDLKGYSPATKKNYLHAMAAMLTYFDGADPAGIEKRAIEDYLLFLAKERKYSEASVHGVMNAVKFYYEAVLRRPKEWWDIYRPKKPEQNPRFFNKEEIAAILNATDNLKHKAILMLCYSAGLRVSEVVALRVRQVDSKRMCLYLEGAKGKKDRVAPLSPVLLVLLREYARQYKPKDFLFEGQVQGTSYSTRSAQKILEAAKVKAGIIKPGSIHALRHSFATHLMDKGTDVVMIQKLLGHNDIKTTLRYLHVTNRGLLGIISPLDDLELGHKAK